MNKIRYAAFLRGINVGTARKVPMEELRKIFESLDFSSTKTLLNSGNVIFETEEKNEEIIRKHIENALQKKFGWEIPVLIRSIKELQEIANAEPFKNIHVTKDTRLYITFLSEKPKETTIKHDKDVKVVRVTDREVCTVITVTPQKNTTDLMKKSEQIYGKNITTRNWNTIQRILKV